MPHTILMEELTQIFGGGRQVPTPRTGSRRATHSERDVPQEGRKGEQQELMRISDASDDRSEPWTWLSQKAGWCQFTLPE